MLKEEHNYTNNEKQECYLVTGAGGHLGGAVVRALMEEKKSVRALLLLGEKNTLPAEVEVFYGDVCIKESMNDFFTIPKDMNSIVIHCAGIVTINSKFSQRVMDVNVGGTRNVLAQCVEHKVEKLVYVSSVHAIPELKSGRVITEITNFSKEAVTGLYAKSKAEATALVLAETYKSSLDASVVHPSGIIGPYDKGSNHITVMIKQFCAGKLTAGVQGGYDFVDVRDVADGIISCAKRGRKGRCYILSGQYATIREMFAILEEVSGRKAPSVCLPRIVAKIFAPAAEHFAKLRHVKPVYTLYSIYTLGTNAKFSHRRATKELGFEPRELKETLKDTVLWLKENND